MMRCPGARRPSFGWLWLLALLAGTSAWPAPPLAAPAIEELAVPKADVGAGSRADDPFVGPGRRLWFVAPEGDYVGALQIDTGELRRFPLPAGTAPVDVVVGDDGSVWYAGADPGHIGRIEPTTGEIRRFELAGGGGAPAALSLDQADDVWFVGPGAAVGRVTVATGEVRLVPLPDDAASPHDVLVTADAGVWATAAGTNKLVNVDPETLEATAVEVPRAEARPRSLAATSDGRIWYLDRAEGVLGFLHPPSGLMLEYLLPGGVDARPSGMAVDADDVLWFVETGPSPDRLVGFDPVTERFGEPVPLAGDRAERQLHHDPRTDVIWFESAGDTLARAVLPR
jgi:virginiamycin B lyase